MNGTSAGQWQEKLQDGKLQEGKTRGRNLCFAAEFRADDIKCGEVRLLTASNSLAEAVLTAHHIGNVCPPGDSTLT
jgi:hypothetical protein